MSNWSLNPDTWDLELDENGSIKRVSGADFLVQNLQQRLRFYLGEWYLDITQGVPWFQEMLGKNRSKDVIEARLKTEILTTDNVQELLEFQVTYDREARAIKNIYFVVLYEEDEIEVTV